MEEKSLQNETQENSKQSGDNGMIKKPEDETPKNERHTKHGEKEEIFSRIILFTTSSKLFFKLTLLSKSIHSYLTSSHPQCAKNIIFSLSHTQTIKSKMEFVQKLHLHKEYVLFKKFGWFKYFPNTREFDIKHQYHFNGKKLKIFKGLKVLKIKGCDKFGGNNLKTMEQLKELKIIENNKLGNRILQCIPNIENLEIVKCPRISNPGEDFKDLNYKKLKKLKIHNCPLLTDEFFGKLFSDNSNEDNLESLQLKWSTITNKSITKFKKLKVLKLWNCDCVSKCVLEELTSSLQHLALTYCKNIEGNISNNFRCLKDLKIINCESITNNLIQKATDTLETLEVKKCKNITNSAFEIEFQKLKHLKLWGLVNIDDSIFTRTPKITRLEVSYCREIKGTNFNHLKSLKKLTIKEGFASETIKYFCNCTDTGLSLDGNNLTSLKLICTKNITGEIEKGEKSFWDSLKTLKKLTIVDNDKLGDQILKKLPNLSKLTLKRCKRVEGSGISESMSLKKIKISDCPKFEKKTLKEIKKKIKKQMN